MRIDDDKNYRKKVRNFKGRVDLMNKTSLKDLEKMFIEIYDFGIQDYFKYEREMQPDKSDKEIIINMYKIREKIKGRKNK